MEAKLVAVAGPAEGRSFRITETLTIGRSVENGIRIEHPSVSRLHCEIRVEGRRALIRDLGSTNGTIVNGAVVAEHALNDRDEIQIGTVVFVFLEEASGRTVPVSLHDGESVAGSTVLLRREDALYLKPVRIAETVARNDKAARDLSILLRIGSEIPAIRELETLERRLFDLLSEAIPAERGAVFLIDEVSGQLVPSMHWVRPPGRSGSMMVSRTIVERVLGESVGLLANEVLTSDEFKPTESMVLSHVSSLVAAPLATMGRPLGVLYMDATSLSVRFEEGHLQLLTGVAGIASTALDNLLRLRSLEHENLRLQDEIGARSNILGGSPASRRVLEFIAKAAPTDSTVLVRGESGTGKELVARAIHRNSSRSARPFVAINCAVLSEALLESDLFGHEKGSFTGAIAQKPGKLETANGGTVFLDEVGELAPMVQAKLLRVLQEREFERVGGTRPIKVDVRVIAATNRNLEEAIERGRFRQDLYYRLKVVSMAMPPLRERREDIPMLARAFAAEAAKKCRRRVAGLSPAALDILTKYDWPGNVRELENAIERAVVMGAEETIQPDDLPEEIIEARIDTSAAGGRYLDVLQETKKQLVRRAVEEAHGSYVDAARLLGLTPNYLHRLIRNLNLKSSL